MDPTPKPSPAPSVPPLEPSASQVRKQRTDAPRGALLPALAGIAQLCRERALQELTAGRHAGPQLAARSPDLLMHQAEASLHVFRLAGQRSAAEGEVRL